MSKPPPCNVQVPSLNNWLPCGAGYPTSAQLQPFWQAVGAGSAVLAVLPESKVTALRVPGFSEETPRPPSAGPLMAISMLDPSRGVQVTPSVEVYVVKIFFQRAALR